MISNGQIIGDGSWNLRVYVTDLQTERVLRVKGDVHIGGVMLRLVEELEISMDWSDHALWWPVRNTWLTRTRSTLDQCGVQADALLHFTPMHKNLRVQLPDLRYLEMNVDFSVKTFAAVVGVCKDLGLRHPEELSFCKPLEVAHLKYNYKEGSKRKIETTQQKNGAVSPDTNTFIPNSSPIGSTGSLDKAPFMCAPVTPYKTPPSSTPISSPVGNNSTLWKKNGYEVNGSYSPTTNGDSNNSFESVLAQSPPYPSPEAKSHLIRPKNLVEKARMNVAWLDSSLSIMEQGVREHDCLCLRFKFYTFYDLNPKYDAIRINQIYEQAKWQLLNEEIDCTEEEMLMFAALQRYRENRGNIDPRGVEIVGRPHSARTVHNEERVLTTLEEDPSGSSRKLPRLLGISQSTVNRITQSNGLHPYHATPVQNLHPGDFQRRIDFCNQMLAMNQEDPNFLKSVLFTDESLFTQEGCFNQHNIHLYGRENPHFSVKRNFQQRWKINMWGGIIGNTVLLYELPETMNLQVTLQAGQPQPIFDNSSLSSPGDDDIDAALTDLQSTLEGSTISAFSNDITQVPELYDELRFLKPKRFTLKAFKRYWFTCKDLHLYLYKSREEMVHRATPTHAVNLKGCEVTPDVNISQNKYGIKLEVPSTDGMSEMYIRCDDEKQYAKWMAACRLAAKGRSLADSSYDSEVSTILDFLQMQRPNERGPVLKPNSLDIQPEDYVAPRFSRKLKGKLVQRIVEAHANVKELPLVDAKLNYIKAWQSLPEYGITLFVVRFMGLKKDDLLGVAHNRLMKMDINNGDHLKTWRFNTMKAWNVNWEVKHMMVQFEEENIIFNCLSADCKVIHEFIGGYIFVSMRSKEANQSLNEELFHKLTGGWS